jgi:GntR family transcriptional regulator, carbon starvation induced regulator
MMHPFKTEPEPGNGADAQPRTLVEDAYRRLREDIVRGKHAPGSRLRVEHMKDDYGVGAGTLREALSLLVADALVVTEGQRGFWVAPISLADLEDVTHVRILLETEALRLSLRRGDDEWEAGVVAAFHRLSKVEEKLKRAPAEIAEWDACNKRFHEALVAAADSRWLGYLIGILYRQAERYRRFAMATNPTKRDLHTEHTEIFEAALRRDEDRAVACLTRHVELTCDAIREQMARAERAERGEDAANEPRPEKKRARG